MGLSLSVSSERARARVLLGGFLRAAPRPKERTSLEGNAEKVYVGVDRLLYFAGLPSSARRLVLARIAAASCLGVMLAGLSGNVAGLLLGPISVLLEYWSLKRASFSRAQEFERDYPALLLALASAVRPGLDPLVALVKCSELFEEKSLIKGELKRLDDLISQGKSEEEVVLAFADSVQHPDIDLFRTAFVLARQEGASLSECLQRLARVTRHRQSFRRRVRGAVAMQKLSAIGIGICAVIIGLIQGMTNPKAFQLALASPVGSRALAVSVALVVFGIAWMFSLTRAKL
ncbi:MAG: type II secretion system F family protein [Oligoflexia bacterium]|nr:type II secretion system F family protein [Oligoflexia bacterium]